nr:hypothetical protein [Tanacetum cinerariifolium]
IHFQPKAIGVLQVNLLHAVGAGRSFAGLAFPAAVAHAELIEVRHKLRQVFYAESQVRIDVVVLHLVALNDVQLAVRPNAQPHVLAIFERLGQLGQQQRVLIKVGALL